MGQRKEEEMRGSDLQKAERRSRRKMGLRVRDGDKKGRTSDLYNGERRKEKTSAGKAYTQSARATQSIPRKERMNGTMKSGGKGILVGGWRHGREAGAGVLN